MGLWISEGWKEERGTGLGGRERARVGAAVRLGTMEGRRQRVGWGRLGLRARKVLPFWKERSRGEELVWWERREKEETQELVWLEKEEMDQWGRREMEEPLRWERRRKEVLV